MALSDRALTTSYRLSVSIFSGLTAIYNEMFQAKWLYVENDENQC